MAITEDMDFPRLTPPDDRMPSGSSLFRSPAELTDEQSTCWLQHGLKGPFQESRWRSWNLPWQPVPTEEIAPGASAVSALCHAMRAGQE